MRYVIGVLLVYAALIAMSLVTQADIEHHWATWQGFLAGVLTGTLTWVGITVLR